MPYKNTTAGGPSHLLAHRAGAAAAVPHTHSPMKEAQLWSTHVFALQKPESSLLLQPHLADLPLAVATTGSSCIAAT
jgi:hypothetical protein